MPDFNILATELIIKILSLAIEDAIATKNDYKRRKILVQLSLVSRVFTLPAQHLLWSEMNSRDFKFNVMGLIREGFGKDKVLQKLTIIFDEDLKVENSSIVPEFLNGISAVKELRMMNMGSGAEFTLNYDLFAIPSLSSVKSLTLSDIVWKFDGQSTPSSLEYFSWTARSRLSQNNHDPFFFTILQPSFTTLTWLSITVSSYSQEFVESILPAFKMIGLTLKTLELYAWIPEIIASLLQFTPALKHLLLPHPVTKVHGFLPVILSVLPSTVRLRSISLTLTPGRPPFPILLALLTSPLPQLSELQKFDLPSGFGYNIPANPDGVEAKFYEMCRKREIKLKFNSMIDLSKEEDGPLIAAAFH